MKLSDKKYRTTTIILVLGTIFAISYGLYTTIVINNFIVAKETVFKVDSPQTILNGHIFHAGDTVLVFGKKCNLTQETVTVDGISWFAEISPNATNYARPSNYGVVYKPLECRGVDSSGNPAPFKDEIPSNIPSGVYRVQGTNYIHYKNQVVAAPWFTEDFTVKDKDK